ncbi:hypothetical protein C9374_008476 [Naegleria lovaniensis]|uniref:Uncharacterized protein n=1 Tax=Naegleria lovaniensis TaxID=51637 RepID=A0AA88GGY0_NAELO|nr:uncharacterized protein C9374_008476 [Naegleria lovaniensis]KAG2378333.1 hypothetical protein C9374_008476 [Naegleria lovaniensis]
MSSNDQRLTTTTSTEDIPLLQGSIMIGDASNNNNNGEKNNVSPQAPKFDEKDQVEVPLNQFLTLLSAYDKYSNVLDDISSNKDKEPPRKTMIQEMDIEGKTEKDKVVLQCKICILVLVDRYTKFKLFDVNDKLTVLGYTVSKEKNTSKNSASEDVITNYFEKEEEVEVPLENNVGFIGVFDGAYCLHTNDRGRYHVTLNLCVPYQSDQKKSLDITFPFCAPRNHLRRFEIIGDFYDLNVEPSTHFTTKFEENSSKQRSTILTDCSFPPTYRLSLYWKRSEKVIQEMLKNTLKNEKKEKKEEKKEEKQLNISVEQHVLHSVGGGLISTSADLDYTIVNGSVNTFYVLLQMKDSPHDKFEKDVCPLRVIRVDGRNIKNWEIKKLKSAATNASTPTQGVTPFNNDNQSESNYSIQLLNSTHSEGINSFIQTASAYAEYFLKVTLHCGVEGSYQLKLLTEKDMKSESCKVHLPTFSCMNVNRDKGFIGVEGITNVEIKDLKNVGLTKLATTELPTKITSKTSDSLLFGYKFLQSLGTDIFLDIKKHDDVQVLVAVIEEALYQITYSESGHLFYRVAMKVKNSSQNYAKVDLVPKDIQYALYSTSVKGEIVRPAIDKEGKILIPLKRGATEMTFSVELYYTVPVKEVMTENGRIELLLPKFNIPTNRSYYYVYLPENYNYGEFEGSMKEVPNFDKQPTVEDFVSQEMSNTSYPRSERQVQSQNRYNAMPQMQMMSNALPMQYQQQAMPQMRYQQPQAPPLPFAFPQGNIRRTASEEDIRNFSDDEDEFEENVYSDESESDDEINDAPTQPSTSSGLVSGVMPVKLTPVTKGKIFLFQKLLISENEDHLKLAVEYKKQQESVLTKRTLLPIDEIFYASVVVVICIVFYLLFRFVMYFLN